MTGKIEFTIVYDWLAKRTDLSWPEKMVIAHILRYDKNEYGCFKSNGNIAKALGFSKHHGRVTVIRIINRLEYMDWVIKRTYPARERSLFVNREKLDIEDLLSELSDPDSFRSRVFSPYLDLISVRRKQTAFHPGAAFEILEIDPRLFAIKRYDDRQTIFALTNISSQPVMVSMAAYGVSGRVKDLLSGETFDMESFQLGPYRYLWLCPHFV